MIGLILEGGGMRAGFVAGALMALMDKGLTGFSLAAAVSASVPTLAYFASGQREEMERVWRFELSTPSLVCYRNIPAASLALSAEKPVIDIDYLVYRVFKERYPVNTHALLETRMFYCFAVTRVPEGRLAFLSPGEFDIYEIFRAAMAVPGGYPRTVCLDGCEYVDGGAVNPFPAGYFLNKGVNRVMAILSTPLNYRHDIPSLFERTLFHRYFQRNKWMLQRLREAARDCNEQIGMLRQMAREKPPRALILYPDEMPPARFITRDQRKINRTIDMGYRKVQELEDQIRDFLQEDTPGNRVIGEAGVSGVSMEIPLSRTRTKCFCTEP
ncbi:MAG: hypothetical protein U5R49_04555 [Deltaproteobacteria bacterium]|nr:hypothetical protein [Deltaproteobacteria bacterium]